MVKRIKVSSSTKLQWVVFKSNAQHDAFGSYPVIIARMCWFLTSDEMVGSKAAAIPKCGH